jgi:hypothetical protein
MGVTEQIRGFANAPCVRAVDIDILRIYQI